MSARHVTVVYAVRDYERGLDFRQILGPLGFQEWNFDMDENFTGNQIAALRIRGYGAMPKGITHHD